jgi:hypothetical protein
MSYRTAPNEKPHNDRASLMMNGRPLRPDSPTYTNVNQRWRMAGLHQWCMWSNSSSLSPAPARM